MITATWVNARSETPRRGTMACSSRQLRREMNLKQDASCVQPLYQSTGTDYLTLPQLTLPGTPPYNYAFPPRHSQIGKLHRVVQSRIKPLYYPRPAHWALHHCGTTPPRTPCSRTPTLTTHSGPRYLSTCWTAASERDERGGHGNLHARLESPGHTGRSHTALDPGPRVSLFYLWLPASPNAALRAVYELLRVLRACHDVVPRN
jgi:hypothetical protein